MEGRGVSRVKRRVRLLPVLTTLKNREPALDQWIYEYPGQVKLNDVEIFTGGTFIKVHTLDSDVTL